MKKIIYIAGVITDKDTTADNFDVSYFENKFFHHMTIQFGVTELPSFMGREFEFEINRMYVDNAACAVTGKVLDKEIEDFMHSVGQVAHVTVATSEGVKPVYSNTLIANELPLSVKPVRIKMKVGAFIVNDDDTTSCIFE